MQEGPLHLFIRCPSIRRDPLGRLHPTPERDTPIIAASFSELKYLIECSYQFKYRFMYGFNPPIHEALGYGKGLHDVLAEPQKGARWRGS